MYIACVAEPSEKPIWCSPYSTLWTRTATQNSWKLIKGRKAKEEVMCTQHRTEVMKILHRRGEYEVTADSSCSARNGGEGIVQDQKALVWIADVRNRVNVLLSSRHSECALFSISDVWNWKDNIPALFKRRNRSLTVKKSPLLPWFVGQTWVVIEQFLDESSCHGEVALRLHINYSDFERLNT